MKADQLWRATLHALDFGGSIEAFVEDKSVGRRTTSVAEQLPIEGDMPSFDGATA